LAVDLMPIEMLGADGKTKGKALVSIDLLELLIAALI
jgi:hypothetical protein